MVRWEDTLLGAVIWRESDGVGHVRQVTDAQCDAPFMTEWEYSPNGRGMVVEDERGSGGCGP